jgi:hypothetical protein
MDWFPDEPALPESQLTTGASSLRYEDVSQDGRLMLLALPHAIGEVIWHKLLLHHPVTRAAHAGIIPILTRFVVEAGDGTLSVRWPLTATGGYQLAHTVGADGQPRHLMLNMWANVTGKLGRTNAPAPAGAGEPVHVGRAFAEHVFTRLFAPPAERRITRFEMEGLPPLPPDRWTWRGHEDVLVLPAGARPLDDLVVDEAPIAFGLNHTDSNQHVNSLVYPRLFQDAALRRLAAHGQSTRLLARRLEIAYRKPCFAGQAAQIVLRTWVDGDRVGAVGAFISKDAPIARPHCTLQLSFVK